MLPRKNRVTTKLFPEVLEKGRFFNSPHFSLRIALKPSETDPATPKFSAVVSKKVEKTAVGRNLIKRRVRATLSPLISKIQPVTGVFFAKKGVQKISFKEIQIEIESLLKQAQAL